MLSGAHGGLLSHAGAFCPVHQYPKFIRGNKLGEGVGDIYVRVALPSAPLSTLATHSADGPVLPVIGCAVRGNGRDIIVAVSEVS